MERKNYEARDSTGAIIPSSSIEVFVSGTLTHADLFSDDLVSPTPLANPFTADINGRFGFYTPDGIVDIVVDSSYTLEAELFDYTLALSPGGAAVTSINGETEAAQTLVPGSGGVDFTIDSAAGVHTFKIPTSSGVARGLLSPVHWQLFNSAIRTLAGLSGNAINLVIGSVGGDANIAPLGTTITINLPTASATKRGLLSSTDWATFNAKQAALTGTTLQYVRGDGSLATLNTLIVPESTNLYFTTARARTALASPTAPLTYNSSTGVFAIPAATGSVNGYLTSANWTTFNNKLGTLNTLTGATQTFSVGTTGTDFAIVSSGTNHAFNLPNASASARGVVSTGSQTFAGAKTFSSPITELKDSDSLTVDGTRYVRTSVTTVDTSIAETDLSTITLGGAPSVGRAYRVRAGGDVRVGTGGTDTVRYRVYLGGSVVWDSGALDLTDTTALVYQLDVDVIVRTAGGAGVAQAIGTLGIADSALATALTRKSTNTTAIVLTGTPVLKTTVQFSVSDVTNQINEQSTVISTLG